MGHQGAYTSQVLLNPKVDDAKLLRGTLFPKSEPEKTVFNMDMQFSTDTKKWLAVQSKDKKADGLFVYAVRTTKIFCRPVCKARLARRSNVAFYESAHEAERAGYRACKRCKPTTSGAMPEEDAVNKVGHKMSPIYRSGRGDLYRYSLNADSNCCRSSPGCLKSRSGINNLLARESIPQIQGLRH